MKNEFALAFNELLEDKKLPEEVIMEAIQAAMVSAYRRAVNASNAQQVDAVVDPDTGKVQIYAEKEVVENVEDDRTEVALKDALTVDTDAEIGGMVVIETTPKNFGRVAAQTARQVIQQRIREAERDVQFKHFSVQLGEIVSGVIQAANYRGTTLGLELKAEGQMPRNQMIPGERFRIHDRIRALLLEVKPSTRGPQIILSRSHKNFLRRLLENEVPEIYQGMVEIRSIAREPGHRSKVAVSALQPGVDPVGACVGIRGVRIQAIVRELSDEKIDVIEWNPDPSIYIAKALSPSRVAGVYLNEYIKGTKTATVVVPEDQLSLAIGRDGQNARLAAKLTGWRIDIKSLPEAATDALHKLQLSEDENTSAIAEIEADNLPQIELILAKKSEGRPVTPEEYQTLTQFVDRVEHGIIRFQEEKRKVEFEREQIARAGIPSTTFKIPLSEFDVSDRIYTVISETGAGTIGDLILQVSIDPDSVYALHGMGPKSWAELQKAIETVKQQAEEQEKAEAEAAAAEEAIEELPEGEITEETEALEEPQVPAELSSVEEPGTEIEPAVEAASETLAEETTTDTEVKVEEPAEEEGKSDLDEIFTMEFSEFDFITDEETDEDEEQKRKKEKKDKRKKYVRMEYDPDQDVLLVQKKRKRGDDEDWETDL